MKQLLHNTSSHGFILVTSLLIVSCIALVTQQLMNLMSLQTQSDAIVIARTQASMLALGGLNIALGQLHVKIDNKREQAFVKNGPEGGDEKEKTVQAQHLLAALLPVINRWQFFPLTKKYDGFDALIKICIRSEEGKLNINKIFNFEKKEFIPGIKLFLQDVMVGGKKGLKRGEFYARLQAFLRKQQKPLEEVSQLRNVPGFEALPLNYEPPVQSQKKGENPPRPIALEDLFTVWSDSSTVEPWLFSDSVCAALGLKRPVWNEGSARQEMYVKAIEQFSLTMGKKWEQLWNILLPFYEKKPHNFNALQKILSQQFDPNVYTVISSGTVQNIEQKLLAIVVKQKSKNSEQQDEQKKKENEAMREEKQSVQKQQLFKIVKLYWL